MKKHERLEKGLVELLQDRKAENIVKLDFSNTSFFTGGFLVATAQSSAHLASLHAEIRKLAKKTGTPLFSESMQWASGWVIMDLGRLVVHLFLKDARENYDLENLWGEVPRINL